MSLPSDARTARRYLRGLRDFWRAPANWTDAPGTIRGWLAGRQDAFADMLRQHVFANPRSPYLRLMQVAGLTEERVLAMLGAHGVEGCLKRLYDAGVYITLDELKGRQPIRRGALEFYVTADDVRTAAPGNLMAPTGGSRSAGVATPIDVADLLYELPPRYLFSRAYGLLERPFALWRPPPPATAGLRAALRNGKLGMKPRRWYGVTRAGPGPAAGKSALITLCTVMGSRLLGHTMPFPRYVPVDHVEVIARWLAEQTRRGASIHLDTMTSGAALICLAARRLGLDISGHIVRVGGEPLTEAKAALFQGAGIRYCSQYGMTEAGTLGLSCAASPLPDDMHLLTYRLAVLQEPRALPGWPEPVGALIVTLFSPRMTTVMLNMEIGDYGVMDERACDCPLGAAGLNTHLHTIRSYDKLTTAGMHFMGTDLIDLLEVGLPGRFGGGPTDYQLVETEVAGATALKLVVSPAVGALDEGAVVAYVLSELERRTKAGRMMTDVWRDADLLHVERALPYMTRAAKILPLHVEHPRRVEGS
jgi:hypothetical protein